METKQIAKITETHLGYEDHGSFSLNVSFDYGGSAQGTGHYTIASPKDRPDGSDAVGVRLIRAVIDACGVSQWEKMVGRTVYVIRENDSYHAEVIGIEPLPTERGQRVIFADIFATVEELAAA